MFHALGNLRMEDGHLDVSFAATDGWPSHGAGLPKHHIPPTAYAAFCLGDPVAGPVVELVAAAPSDATGYLLTHLHRCDTFRISLRGDLIMTPAHLGAGQYELLESGNHYTQGFGPSPQGQWTFLVTADRRGKKEKFANMKKVEQFMADYAAARVPVADGEPPPNLDALIPESFDEESDGFPAIATTVGTARRGVIDGDLASGPWAIDLGEAVLDVALLGDVDAGPVLLLVRGAPGAILMPPVALDTEVAVAVVRGGARIGDLAYGPGDVRIQGSEQPMPAVEAGSGGCDAVIVVADRRVGLGPASSEPEHARWLAAVRESIAELRATLDVGMSV